MQRYNTQGVNSKFLRLEFFRKPPSKSLIISVLKITILPIFQPIDYQVVRQSTMYVVDFQRFNPLHTLGNFQIGKALVELNLVDDSLYNKVDFGAFRVVGRAHVVYTIVANKLIE